MLVLCRASRAIGRIRQMLLVSNYDITRTYGSMLVLLIFLVHR